MKNHNKKKDILLERTFVPAKFNDVTYHLSAHFAKGAALWGYLVGYHYTNNAINSIAISLIDPTHLILHFVPVPSSLLTNLAFQLPT